MAANYQKRSSSETEPAQTMTFKIVIACGTSQPILDIYRIFFDDADKCCHQTGDFVDALRASRHFLRCIIFVDQDELTDEGRAQLRIRTALGTDLRVILLVRDASLARLADLLRLGFAGFLQHDSSAETIRKAVERVAQGELWAGRKLTASALRSTLGVVNDTRLTSLESEILRRLAEGHNNRKIAGDLFITRETVRWHLRSAYSKLGIHNRKAAADILFRETGA
jgi:two-component system, NarL family, nitrate/nitrite response regulator NarL